MANRRALGYGLIVGASFCSAASAHHSYARFDVTRTVTLEGTVKDYQWTNPHVWIQVSVKDPATGQLTEWSIESDSPVMLARRGWNHHTLKVGDAVVAVIHPLKIPGSNQGGLESVMVNGQPVAAPTPVGAGGQAPAAGNSP